VRRPGITRRDLLRAGAVAGPALAWPGAALFADDSSGRHRAPAPLRFKPIRGSRQDAVLVPEDHVAQVLLRWGDALWSGAPSLDVLGMTRGSLLADHGAAAQERQFGYNCDALQFFPLESTARRGLLAVNHEYTNDELMFPGRLGLGREGAAALEEWCRRHPAAARFALAAHGASVIEVELNQGMWRMVPGTRWTRRVTGRTPIEIAGPARGHALLRTRDDPGGTVVLGMLGNCAGGKTPWGTYLTAEENIDDYFGRFDAWRAGQPPDSRLLAAHRRFPLMETSLHGWEFTEARFDVRNEPREALRFGWIVEIDPLDPASPVRKRTALGRFCHEGATCVVTRDGRVAVYTGDDDKFEYLYKFVSRDRCDPRDRRANRDLLDHGTLHVARFDSDGTGEWLPLVHGRGPLVASAGFADQAEVLIRARAAADLLGATPMDRPEDVEVNPRTGLVYVAFTKNDERSPGASARSVSGRTLETRIDAANPRPANDFGHILEIAEMGEDAGATTFHWSIFLLAGDPREAGARFLTGVADLEPGRLASHDTYYAGFGDAQDIAPIGCPDNLGFDPEGHLWIVTDGAQPRGDHNGAFAVPVAGSERGRLRQFMSAPRGAEVCGCEFTPDGETLFLSVQHPGEGGTLSQPISDWPDRDGRPPRPSVIAVRRRDRGRVGS
jgi:secreted PhoX family phosphatase